VVPLEQLEEQYGPFGTGGKWDARPFDKGIEPVETGRLEKKERRKEVSSTGRTQEEG